MCILCGNKNSKIDERYEPFSIVTCPNCGKYVISEECVLDIGDNTDLKSRAIMAIKKADCEWPFIGNQKSYEIYKQRNLLTKATLVEF